MKNLSITFICFLFSINVFTQEASKTDIEKVTLCDLSANPTKYYRKKIQVNATYIPEVALTLLEPAKNCPSKQLSNTVVSFEKNWKTNTNKEIVKKFDNYFNKEFTTENRIGKIDFVSTGYFSCRSKKSFDNGFNCSFKIVKIDSVSKPSLISEVFFFDPPTVSLKKLFLQADLVAFVRINSGDAENYKKAIYKATVLQAFKGTKKNNNIYFTPFVGYRLGSEYLVFLKKSNKRIEDIVGENSKAKILPYDKTQRFHQIMYEGYSVMPVSYECVFEEPSQDRCQFAVKFNTRQVILPKNLKVFPEEDEYEVFNYKFVKKSKLKPILERLKKKMK